jgi:predicted phage terminase large subunit-like protein
MTPPHLRVINGALDKVETGEIKRLIIQVPPRHGKSETVSRKFPSYFLGKHPDDNVILASYGYNLSKGFSRANRDLIESRRYRLIFPLRTAHDSRSVGDWSIAGHRGGLLATGVGGATTGFGAHLFIIDDPIKNKEEADSEVIREKHWDWYRSVVLTRLEPGARLVIMMTRWHQQDLVGKILAQAKEDGELDDWTVINLPALAQKNDTLGRKEGEALWPARYDAPVLEKRKKAVGSRIWNALFQGNPMDPESAIFSREWFQYYRALPMEYDRFAGIDTATSLKTSADHSAVVDVCKDWEKKLYVDDVLLEKLSVRALAKHVSQAHAAKKYRQINLEQNNAGEAVRQRIEEVGREDETRPPVHSVQVSTDKVVRANEWAHLVENGSLKFKQGNPRVAQLIEHLVNFDGKGGDTDDDVDALGHAISAATGGAHLVTLDGIMGREN